MSKIIETCPNRSSFSRLESCMENLKGKQQIMCIICKNDSLKILLSTEYEYPGDIFLEFASTWARNQKTGVLISSWHPTQFPASFKCLFFFNTLKEIVCVIGHKSGAIRWCTKVIFYFLSSLLASLLKLLQGGCPWSEHWSLL